MNEAKMNELFQAEDIAYFRADTCLCSPESYTLKEKRDICNEMISASKAVIDALRKLWHVTGGRTRAGTTRRNANVGLAVVVEYVVPTPTVVVLDAGLAPGLVAGSAVDAAGLGAGEVADLVATKVHGRAVLLVEVDVTTCRVMRPSCCEPASASSHASHTAEEQPRSSLVTFALPASVFTEQCPDVP